MPVSKKVLWLVLFLLPVVWQLWVPPYIGLADNGDFGKVTGRYALAPQDPGPQATFLFFNRIWKADPSAFWLSEYWGFEVWLAKLALWIGGTNPFDMRWIGLIHALIFAVAAWLWIGASRTANLAKIVILTDVAYVSYFQSFYFDAATIVFLVLLFGAWHRKQPVLLFFGALGFALSKAPHAPAALLLALVLLWERRRSFVPAALVFLLGGGYMLSQTKTEYKATAYYNLAFFKLGLLDSESLRVLEIRPEDHRLVGTHAFMPNSPTQDGNWLREFYPKRGYGNVLYYYASHPGIALRVLWTDLENEASQIRAENLGNYERSTGVRYCTLSNSFGWYSKTKSWLFAHAPWHVLFLIPFAAWRIGARPIVLALFGLGTYEFLIASLADACETYRHLLVFHLSYDLMLCVAISKSLDQRAEQIACAPPVGVD